MTFWEDVKNALIGVTGLASGFETIKTFYDRAVGKEELKDISDADLLSKIADNSIKNKSEFFGVVPNLVGMPILGDIYSPGFGVLVRRRVSSVYQSNLLSPMDYISYNVRYPEKELDLRYYMSELGYNKDQENIMNDLYKFYPAARDFITFGVREVFRPEIVSKYGYDKDFPSDILPYAQKAGLNEDVMKWYWRSHWQLPSFYNIREARWRGLIDDKGVDEFLKVADYPEYWRGMLKGIINTPYTRVDVRRLYDSGVIDRDMVKRNYLDIGYDDSHAENLTKFTVINADKTKEVLSTFVNGYKQGLVTEEELKAKMQQLEYSNDEITLRIQILNTKEVIQPRKRHLTLTNIKKLYQEGFITTEILETMLISLNYDSDGIKYMKMLIIAETEPYKAWVSEIKKAYLKGILTRDEATSRFTELGYTLQAINLSLDLIDLKKKESESS